MKNFHPSDGSTESEPENLNAALPRPSRRKLPLIRWSWIGLALAAVLWFGSNIYFAKVKLFDEIEYASDTLSKQEERRINQQRQNNYSAVHAFAVFLGAASLGLASFQIYRYFQSDQARKK